MIHPIEHVAAGVVVICIGAFVWLAGPPTPRPKPEEFVLPPVEFIEPASQEQTATIRVQPMPLPKEEQEQKQITIDELLKKAERINKKLDEVEKEK